MAAIRKTWMAWFGSLILLSRLLWGPETGAQNPAQWEEAMRTFAAADAASPPHAEPIVFTGSSSIVMWKTLPEDLTPLTVLNRGFGGSTLQEALYWLDEVVLKYRPRAVALYEGDKDIGHLRDPPNPAFH